MPAAEVKEIQAVLAGADRHLVGEGPLRQKFRIVALEGVHLRHVRLGVLLRDDVDRGREHRVAARVVAMGMRIDDHRDRLVGHRLDFVEDDLAPSGQLRVDHDDAVRGDEHAGVAAPERISRSWFLRPGNHVQVVAHLLNSGDRHRARGWPRRSARRGLSSGNNHRERSHADNHAKQLCSPHDRPPGKNTR